MLASRIRTPTPRQSLGWSYQYFREVTEWARAKGISMVGPKRRPVTVVFLCLICYKLGKPCIRRFGDSESSKYMAQHIVTKHPEAKTTTYELRSNSRTSFLLVRLLYLKMIL